MKNENVPSKTYLSLTGTRGTLTVKQLERTLKVQRMVYLLEFVENLLKMSNDSISLRLRQRSVRTFEAHQMIQNVFFT